MLFAKMIGDPTVGPTVMRAIMQANKNQEWVKHVAKVFMTNQVKREYFLCDVEGYVIHLESDLENLETFAADPFRVEKLLLVINAVLNRASQAECGELENLRQRSQIIADKTRPIRVGATFTTGRIAFKEDRYPPAWDQIA
ncbi:MAG: hypothetical protein WCW31_05430 [Patescibacteria group bacterium]|jgi:hypothetical protein